MSNSCTQTDIIAFSLSSLAALVLTAIASFNEKSKKYPPRTKEGILETLQLALRGKFPEILLRNARELGPVYRLNFLTNRIVCVICDPVLSRALLESDCNKSKGYEKFQKLTFNRPNIISKDTFGDGWDWARKAVSPSFSYTNLHKTLPLLNVRLTELESVFEQCCQPSGSNAPIDMGDYMLRFTFNFIAASMFNENYSMKDEHSDGSQFLHDLHIAVAEHFKSQTLKFSRLWNGEPQRAQAATNRLQDITQKILDGYRAKHTEEETAADSSILAHIIRSPYPSDLDRCADMIVFLIGGHDTTAYTLAWTFVELSRNPDVLSRVRAELATVNPDLSQPFDVSQLSRLEYLLAVIKEAMRLWPVVATGSGRRFDHDVTVGDYVIPKDTSVLFPFYPIFRTGIKNPDTFNPDRWLVPDEDSDMLKTIFMPFSVGRRNCIGQNLAMLEMKLVLATLLRRFDFRLVSEVEANSYLTMKPDNALFTVHRLGV